VVNHWSPSIGKNHWKTNDMVIMDHGISSIMRIGKPLIGKLNMEKPLENQKTSLVTGTW
jgi:hypothetical protein